MIELIAAAWPLLVAFFCFRIAWVTQVNLRQINRIHATRMALLHANKFKELQTAPDYDTVQNNVVMALKVSKWTYKQFYGESGESAR